MLYYKYLEKIKYSFSNKKSYNSDMIKLVKKLFNKKKETSNKNYCNIEIYIYKKYII